MWFFFFFFPFLFTVLASGILKTCVAWQSTLKFLEKNGFIALSELQRLILRVLKGFHGRCFLLQGFNIERETGQHGAVTAISFFVPFLKTATTKLVSALWFTLFGLLFFCYSSPSQRSTKKTELCSCASTARYLTAFKNASWEDVAGKLAQKNSVWGCMDRRRGIYLKKKNPQVDFYAFSLPDA